MTTLETYAKWVVNEERFATGQPPLCDTLACDNTGVAEDGGEWRCQECIDAAKECAR